MTTEDDFQARLTKKLKDWQTRMVFADWLEERNDPRAEGYRALGACKLAPFFWHYGKRWSWQETVTGKSIGVSLKECWFQRLSCGGMYKTRQEAEDDAALAFSKLSDRQKREILAGTLLGVSK